MQGGVGSNVSRLLCGTGSAFIHAAPPAVATFRSGPREPSTLWPACSSTWPCEDAGPPERAAGATDSAEPS